MSHLAIWVISFLSVAGVIIQPFKVVEGYYALTGAILLVLFELITPRDAFTGISKGIDVYLFLIGMMILAETARDEDLFEWLTAQAIRLYLRPGLFVFQRRIVG